MIIDISSIFEKNTLLELEKGHTLDEVIKALTSPYYLEENKKNDSAVIIMGDVEFFFNSNELNFGILNICGDSEVFYKDMKIDENTSLESIRLILNFDKITFSEKEIIKDNQFNVELENGAILYFDHFNNSYFLVKIYWGVSPNIT